MFNHRKKTIGLIDADLLDKGTRHPNLALMKISQFLKNQNSVHLLESYDEINNYDVLYVSKVFNFTRVDNRIFRYNNPIKGLKKNVFIGGTGFFNDGGEDLPNYIEHIKPDYTLYDEYIKKRNHQNDSKFKDYLYYSIGFTTRGCFRKCSFCVNKKYNRVIKHSPVSEFLDESRPRIYLWDDNFMASKDFFEVLDELDATKKPFQFRQGLDLRLMTEKKAIRLSTSKYHGDFIFAFDYIQDKELISSKLKLWRNITKRSTKLYVLTAYESQDIQDIVNTFERIKIIMEHGCLPYIMRFETYKQSSFKNVYIQVAR